MVIMHAKSLSVQFSSVAQSCLTLCNPMNHSTPGLPVHHQLQEFTQTHVHRVSDAIQPSHPLLSPSPPAPNPSQHQFIMSNSFVTRGTVAHQAPLSIRFSMQEYWSGLPFSPPGYLPDPRIKTISLASPALTGGFFAISDT